MKRAIQWQWLVFSALIMTAALPPLWAAPVAGPDASTASMAGYLENVTFEKLPGKERVTLAVSKQSGVTVENQPGNTITVRLENLFVPEGLRHPLGDKALANVVRVTPVQKSADGRSWVVAMIELKQKVPYSVRQEGMNILVDFNVTTLASAAETVPEKPSPAVQPMVPKPAAVAAPTPAKPEKDAAKAPAADPGKKVYTGSRIFLDVQDADIKAIFRLLAEQGKVSIVSGDDVKGTMTLHMTDIPWDQALDTILDIKGLDKRQDGKIITIITLDRKKKDEADRMAVEAAQLKQDDERKVREQKQNVEQGKLKQISIEARIVEVNTNFTRDLGIRWGYGYRDSWQGRDIGMLMGNSNTGDITSLPTGIGLTKSNTAVNFPSLIGAAGAALTPGIGIVMGSSQFILDAKLAALENSGDGRIISSPKVTTLENEKATIWQGKKVPVVTPGTSTSPPTVRDEDADLRLIVTPKIAADKERISMEIEASNKDIDYSFKVQDNPAINTSGVTSKIVVRDGDTIVVGGVFKTTENFTKDGVPWLSDIPWLGWLFKYESKTKETRELLVFITPRVVTEAQ
ncbi:MAG: secretin and TonB N-terminal domain-containing protein [Syntrophales bacterium]